MKLLITGGAGFIGSAVVRHLVAPSDHEVVVANCLTYAGSLASPVSVKPCSRYRFEKVDIGDSAGMARVLHDHQPDGIVHLEVESRVDRSIDGPEAFIQTNIVGTYCLLEAARHYFDALTGRKRDGFRFHHDRERPRGPSATHIWQRPEQP